MADPTQYVVLVDDDYQVHPDLSVPDDGSPTADVDGTDTDLARIVLHALPASADGTASLAVSDPANVRLFEANGQPLPTSDLTDNLTVPGGGGYLAGLLGQDVVVWVQAISIDSNEVVTFSYDDPGSGTVTSDGVHMELAERGRIRVDANRDGTINFMPATPADSDQTTVANPYSFWLNNNDDQYSASPDNNGVGSYGDDSPADPTFRPDYSTGYINNSRDLEDFLRLAISPPTGFAENDPNWSVFLSFTVTSGVPSVKLFGVSAAFASQYLTNTNATDPRERNADECQLSAASPTYTLSTQDLAGIVSNGRADFLLEAGTAGNCSISVHFAHFGFAVSSDSTYFNFKPVEQFYDTFQVGTGLYSYGSDSWNNNLNSAQLSGYTWPSPTEASTSLQQYSSYTQVYSAYSASSSQAKSYVLFVPGWRMLPSDRTSFADTSFKRLF